MSAIPLRQEAPKTCILEVYNTDYTLNPYSDRLTSQGYEVVHASSYDEGIKQAHACHPALIVVHDDPNANIDAAHWLELQHYDRIGELAMTPLMILADSARVPALHVEEIPDRVVVIPRRADTLNQLARTVKHLLRTWQLE
jgi:hypothetical protein